MNIYKFEIPWGISIVCAKDKEEAKDIFWNGDGDEDGCKEYFYGKNIDEIVHDDEPLLIDISTSHIIGFHCG